MPRPKDIAEKIDKIINAWETLAPTKSFGGMTLTQFKEAVFPSKETRGLIETLETQLAQAIDQPRRPDRRRRQPALRRLRLHAQERAQDGADPQGRHVHRKRGVEGRTAGARLVRAPAPPVKRRRARQPRPAG